MQKKKINSPKPCSIGNESYPILESERELSGLLSGLTLQKSFIKNTVLVRHGDKADTLWLVLSGWVKLVRQTPSGSETIVGLCTNSDLFGEAALFPHGHYPYYAETLSDCTLALIPSSILRQKMEINSEVSRQLMALLNERIHQAQLKLEHMTTLSASQRLSCFLLRLCRGSDKTVHKIHIPVDKQIIASFLVMKPETLSRSFQQLKAQGVSVKGETLLISNIEKLKEFVCTHCSESGMCEVEEAL